MKTLIRFSLLFCTLLSTAQVKVDQMWVENKTNPLGITTKQPRFSWSLISDKRGVGQQAYELQVATSEVDLNKGQDLLWDSGEIQTNQSVHLNYDGPALKGGQSYYWKVRVRDTDGKRSRWSTVGSWQMGWLDPQVESTAAWIRPGFEEDTLLRPSPYFRNEFNLDKPIRKATAYITAHGMYEARINGRRVGDAYLTPGWTSYDSRLQYQMYDVTELLRDGANAVGAVLGSGWYRDYLAWGDRRDHYGNDIALLLQINLEYEDGTQDIWTTDNNWKSTTGPILNSEIYDGETYDSTRELAGWDETGYDDGTWSGVTVAEFGKTNLIPTENEPIRKQEVFTPVAILTTPDGDTVVDFGQNLVGWVQLKVHGSPGQKITLTHTEVLDKEGNFYTENLRAADQQVSYILKGNEEQLLEPHFTFQGFRYVKVEGFTPEVSNLKAIALYSDMPPTGDFSTSDELLNQLQHNIQWGQRGNFLDVPTDCPQRDERLGWTGDAQAFFRTAAYNRNVNAFFSKWLKDLAADQLENGSVPFVIPNVLGENAAGSAGWGDVATIIPWESYLLYGDKDVLRTQYPSMKQWVEYIRSRSTDHLWNSGFHFGDWLFYIPEDDRDGRAAITDKYLITQSFYAYSTQLLLKAARVLGEEEDIREYSNLLDEVVKAFQKEYLTPSGRLVSGTQTAYVLALQFDLLPEELRAQAADRLVENIQSYGYHLTTGFLGTPYLAHVLSRYGHTDVAYKLLMQKTYPSWLYPVTQGATTIWERWDGIKPDGTFQTPSMNSYNHYAYGAIGDWMYQHIAGIQASEDGPGYKHFRIAVSPGGGLKRASGSLRTYYGEILSSWKLEGNSFVHQVNVPVNTSAELIFPFGEWETIREDKRNLDKVRGIKRLPDENGQLKIELQSGSYTFTVPADLQVLVPLSFEGTYNFVSGFSSQVEIKEADNGNLHVTSQNRELIYTPDPDNPLKFNSVNDASQHILFFKNDRGEIEGYRYRYGTQRFEALKL